MSYSYDTSCILCNPTKWFHGDSDAKAEKLKNDHVAAVHPDYELIPGYGWVRKAEI